MHAVFMTPGGNLTHICCCSAKRCSNIVL